VIQAGNGDLEVLVLLLNSDGARHRFKLSEPKFDYTVHVDTNNPGRIDVALKDGHCDVASHSLVLLTARMTAEQLREATHTAQHRANPALEPTLPDVSREDQADATAALASDSANGQADEELAPLAEEGQS